METRLTTSVRVEDGHPPDPLSVFTCLRDRFPGECFLLESTEGPKKAARYSFIGANPLMTFRSSGDQVELNGQRFRSPDPYSFLEGLFSSIGCGETGLAPFSGGMVGYLGFNTVRYFEDLHIPVDQEFPEMYFVLPEHLVCVDHLGRRTFLISHGKVGELQEALRSAGEVDTEPLRIGEGRANIGEDRYTSMVQEAKENILDGEIFQVVLSRRMDFRVDGDPLRMYRALRSLNPSPYLFFLDFQEMELLGSSPEMLCRLEGKELTTRPLAGTRPRSPDPEEDEKLKLHMLLDEKERAEHLMLVDLHRNDMGRVSRPGSVKVTELMGVEKYSHVQHLVSNIRSDLAPGFDAFDALRSCFPAGTVSGAPKIRAMEIINRLEGCSRGPYAGAVGYFDFSGSMDFGITIRSIVASKGRARVQAGAGVVADSVPSNEFRETEHKMGAMLQALQSEEG
ncbi:MAG: anthranilate synthase component I family protein [Methanomassiliicoccales archaeon]